MGPFQTLLDFSFSTFITAQVIKFVYAILLVVGALVALIGTLGAFANQGLVAGIVALLVAVVGYFLYVLVARIYCEILIVIFNIAADLRALRLASQTGEQPPKPL